MKINTKTISSRIISSILVLGMIFSSCPVTTFADTTTTEANNTETSTEASTDTTSVVVTDDSQNDDTNVNSIPKNDVITSEDVVNDTEKPPKDNTTEVTTTEKSTEASTSATTTEKTTTEKTTQVTTSELTSEKTTEVTTTEAPTTETSKDEFITFDHYFTDIDESLVKTSDLLIQTSDKSIFTKNTNVISNYDNVYVISCKDVTEARFVYSYYVNNDKVINITDMSNVMTLADDTNTTKSTTTTNDTTATASTTEESTNNDVTPSKDDVADLSSINESDDAISYINNVNTKNYSGYIALIDSGVNADVSYSVIDDNPTVDSNGHATKMLSYIREENPTAKVMSIKAFDGNTTSAANIYAAIELAIESKVSIINMSFAGIDIEQNAIIKDAINDAINAGITVIGAAGNYNQDATNFIPGCIDKVYTIGATNKDGIKTSTSNYNADYYVVANSTSEATARFSGIYSNNTIIENIKVFTVVKMNSKDAIEPKNTLELQDFYNGDTVYWYVNNNSNFYVGDNDNFPVYIVQNDPAPVGSFRVSKTHKNANGTTKEIAVPTRATCGSPGMNSPFLQSNRYVHWTISTLGQEARTIYWSKLQGNHGDVSANSGHILNTANSYSGSKIASTVSDCKVTTINNAKFEFSKNTNGKYETNALTVSTKCAEDTNNFIDVKCNYSPKLDAYVARRKADGTYAKDSNNKIIFNKVTDYGKQGTDKISHNVRLHHGDKIKFISNDTNKKNYTISFTSVKKGEGNATKGFSTGYYIDNVYKLTPSKDGWSDFQNMVFPTFDYATFRKTLKLEDSVTLTVEKITDTTKAAQAIVDDNPNNYDLEGTTFKAYTDKAGKKAATDGGKQIVFVMDSNGEDTYEFTNTAYWNSESHTIYLIETKAGKGYILDKTPHAVIIKPNTDNSVTIKNVPKTTTKLKLTKKPNDSYKDYVKGNDNYKLDETSYGLYTDAACKKKFTDGGKDQVVLTCSKQTTDKDGYPVGEFSTYTFNTQMYGKTLYIKEKTAGQGYTLDKTSYKITFNKARSNYTYTKTLYDDPISDPVFLEIQKVGMSTNGNSNTVSNNTKYPFNGDNGKKAQAINAEYTITQYYDAKLTKKGRTWVYTTEDTNEVVLSDTTRILSGTPYLKSTRAVFPLGYYKIQETKAPSIKDSGKLLGLKRSSDIFYVSILPKLGKFGSYVSERTIYKNKIDTANKISSIVAENETTPEIIQSLEPETWYSLGLIKVDSSKKTAGAPQGDATFKDARYYVYSSNDKIFAALNSANDKTHDGYEFNVDSTTNRIIASVNGVKYPVVIITNDEGYGYTAIYNDETAENPTFIKKITLPFSTSYYAKEYKAPRGYELDSKTEYKWPSNWYNEDSSLITIPKDKIGISDAIAIGTNGTVPDTIRKGKIVISKTDANLPGQTAQGDASVEGIKYAVILTHKGADGVTNQKSVVYSGKTYTPGQIVAITSLSSAGTATVDKLPYATYKVFELRKDSTYVVGDTYSINGTKNGTSIYANDSYLFTDKFDSVDIKDSSEYSVDFVQVSLEEATDAANTKQAVFKNYVRRGNINIKKFDIETDTQVNQGINSLENIKYAIVNRSAHQITYNGVTYDVNDVVAVLKTNTAGNCSIKGLPIGTYAVYELRKDATITVGDNWDNSGNKKGTSKYSNDYYIYSDFSDESMIDSTVNNKVYTVKGQKLAIDADTLTPTGSFKNAPVRGNITFTKKNEKGEVLPYVPFLVSRLDKDGNVLESHVIIADKNGVVNTATRAKSKATVNTLDKYYDSNTNSYTGPVNDSAASVNIWFGDISKVVNDKYISTARGSFLIGDYHIEELRCDDVNAHYSFEERNFTITEDLKTIDIKDIIDTKIIVGSNAADVRTGSTSLTVDVNASVRDGIVLTNAKSQKTYKIEAEVYNIKEDGTSVKIGGYTSDLFTLVQNADKTVSVKWKTNGTNKNSTLVNSKFDLTFNVDSSKCEPGTSVAVVDTIYEQQKDGSWREMTKHNEDFSVDSQKLYIPAFETEAVNDVTKTNIGSVDPVTSADDKLTYKNFGNNDYDIVVDLVNDKSKVLTDVDGKACTRTFKLITNEKYTTVAYNNNTVYGPTTGSFLLKDSNIEPFKVAATDSLNNAHFVITVKSKGMDNGKVIDKVIFKHNENLDDANEIIRWLKISTVASSNTGMQGIIAQDTEAKLVDEISYTNCAQDVDVDIKGHVYVQESSVDKNGKTVYTLGDEVTTASKTEKLSVGDGKTNLEFTFDSTPYANKNLVVCEYIYLSGTDILISKHDDAGDMLQTVKVPDIKTTLVNVHKGTGYKVISEKYEDITVIDKVDYSNLIPGSEWQLTATLMNGENPVLDADGNVVSQKHIFTPSKVSGVENVEMTFKQVLKSRAWEDDESWVCFESLQSPKYGGDEFNYVVHNDLSDKNQTITHPKFKTTAKSANGTKAIEAAPNQTVIDTVELKNFAGSEEVKNSTKFTLKIEAINALTNEPILNNGKPVQNTKLFNWNESMKTVDIDCTFDATGLDGSIITFYETLYFGDSTDEDDIVLREDDSLNMDQSVTVPKIHTNARDKDTNTKNISLNRVLVDEITAENILANKKFSVTTKVVDKTATNEARKTDPNAPEVFLKDTNGKDIEQTFEYTSPSETINYYVCSDCKKFFTTEDEAKEHCGTEFTYDTVVGYMTNDVFEVSIDVSKAENIEGHDLVVYEYMTYGGNAYTQHTDINDKDQTIEVPKIHTKASDAVKNTNIIDGTSKNAKVIDTVTYTNLIPGVEYEATGKWAIVPEKNSKTNKVEYVKDKNGKIVTSTIKFVADKKNGTYTIPFTIDASKYAGKKITAFESLSVNGVEIAIHADITDKDQTLIIPLKLHIKVAKADRDNIKYFLQGAEITVYKKSKVKGDKDTIALDANGNKCIGTTDKNGQVDFTIVYNDEYDETDEYYVMETKAPRGYDINTNKFEVKPSGDKESLGTDVIKISILDGIINIPKTSDTSTPIYLFIILLAVGVAGITSLVIISKKKNKKSDNEDNTNDDTDTKSLEDDNSNVTSDEPDENNSQE